MRIFAPKETLKDETRVSLLPDSVKAMVGKGADIIVESGLGSSCGISDAAYEAAGAKISQDRKAMLESAEMVLRLSKPSVDEVTLMKPGTIHISYVEPFTDHALVDAMLEHKISCICMEMIPRTTLAQKMDALSSQANLGGYVAVLLAANALSQVLPMMMTPAGTLRPAKVFIIGCGVAGLQAIATAKRLGARVEAFDTRPVVEEQVQSLGAKFVKIDLGETGQTSGGYAQELTEAQKDAQHIGMTKVIAESDIVITTAQLFGRPAPRLMTLDMVKAMKPGSVVVDMAVETGGNVEGSVAGENVDVGGVTIIGAKNLPGRVPLHASQMYSANLTNLLTHFWDKESKTLKLNTSDEIMDGCLITHEGELRSEMLQKAREKR